MSVVRVVRMGAARRAALDYAITSAVAIGLPLLVGMLTGYPARGALMALGAFLVATSAPQGPYGVRARFLFAAVGVLGAGVFVGGLVSDHRVAAALVVPVAVAIGSALPRVGLTWGLATLLAAVRPLVGSLPETVLVETAGGLLVALLFLVPWPHRRLRPFLVATAGATAAMAALLDTVTGTDAAWGERRRAATEALGTARTARGLILAAPAGTERPRPDLLIDALTRLLHEIVALRALVLELRRWEPEREIMPVIAALSSRIRLLARTIGSAGRVPLDERGPAVPRHIAERIEEIRRAALTGETEDLVAVAQAGRLLDTVERVAATVERAADLVVAGIRVGTAVPRLPAGRGPAALWHAVRTDVTTRSPRLRRTTRAGLATAVAMAVWVPLRLPHGYWLPVTVVLCMRHTYGETASLVLQQVAGSTAGAVLGAVLLAVAPDELALVAVMFGIALVAYALRSVGHAVWMTFATPLIMMLVDYAADVDWLLAAERIELTIGGGVLALVVARLFWPSSGERTALRSRLPDLCEAHAELMRTIAARLDGSDRPLDEPFAVVRESIDGVGESLRLLSEEPGHRSALVSALREAMTAALRIKDDLISVADLSGERAVDAGPVPAILDQVAGRLAAVAGDLRACRPPAGGALELDDRLAELDAFLCALVRRRRAEVAAGGDLEECTPLRRTLVQAAAVRHALRSLCGNAEDLTRASALVAGFPR